MPPSPGAAASAGEEEDLPEVSPAPTPAPTTPPSEKEEDGSDRDGGGDEDDSTSAKKEASPVVSKVKSTKKLSDADWMKGLSDSQREWFEAKAKTEEELEDVTIVCTSCYEQVNHKAEGTVVRHPVLNVPICKKCKKFYYQGLWKRDDDGYFEYCRWCANGGDLLCCSNKACKNSFCKKCVKRNLGRTVVSDIQDSDEWHCFACTDVQIREVQVIFYSIYKYWMSQKAVADKQEATRLERESRPDDLVLQLLSEATDTIAKFKSLIDLEKRLWGKQRHSFGRDEQAFKRGCLRAAKTIRKITGQARRNVDKLERSIRSKVKRDMPEVEVVWEEEEDDVDTEQLQNGDGCIFDSDADSVRKKSRSKENGTKNGKTVSKSSATSKAESSATSKAESSATSKAESSDDSESDAGAVKQRKRKNEKTTIKVAKEERKKKESKKKESDEKEEEEESGQPSQDESMETNHLNDDDAMNGEEDMEDDLNLSLERDDNDDDLSLIAGTPDAKAKKTAKGPGNSSKKSPGKSPKAGPKSRVKKADVEEEDVKDEQNEKQSKEATEKEKEEKPVNREETEKEEEEEPEKEENVESDEYERVKQEVLKTSSELDSDDEKEEEEEKKEEEKKTTKKLKSKKQLDRLHKSIDNDDNSDSDNSLSDISKPKGKKSEPTVAERESDDDGDDDDNLGLGSPSSSDVSESELLHDEFKPPAETKKKKKEKEERPKLSKEERLKRRYAHLIRKIDREKDEKLKKAVQVQVERLAEKVRRDLEAFGEVYVKDFPALDKLCRKRKKNKHLSFDAEIDRLCNLSNLDKPKRSSKSKKESQSDDDEDSQNENASPSKRSRSQSSKKKHKKKSGGGLDQVSSGSDVNGAGSDVSDDDGAKMNRGEKALFQTENDLAKAAVLATSSDEDDEANGVEVSDSEKEGEDKKKGKKEKKAKEEKKGKKEKNGDRKKGKNDPSFMRVKLDETDSSEEEAKAKKKREKKDKEKGSEEDKEREEEELGKKGGKKRKRNVISDSDSDVEAIDDDDDEENEDEGKETDESEEVMPKPKRRRRKKSSGGGSSSDSDSEEKSKKKRKRIKKNSSSEGEGEGEGEKNSGDENDDENSPSKGRHNIRKIIKDKKLSKDTREAAIEERERRKRMDEKQKEYNKKFEVTEGAVLKSLPLDYDAETDEIFVEVDKRLVKKLKPHQAKGIKFMWDATFETKKDVEADKVPGGAILAHCMGLGKTLQTITLVHTVHTQFPEQCARILILCPVNTVKNWEEEFEKWCPGKLEIDVHEMSGEKDNWGRADRLGYWYREGGVMIMGYDMFRNLSNEATKKFKKKQKQVFQESLVDPGPNIVVCDEGHVLKNLKSALNQAMNRIKTKRRIMLTGTPLQNNLSEYYAMVNFVKPQLLGTYNEFKNRFCNPIQNGQHSDSTDRDVRVMKKRSFILSDLLKGCMQRLDYNVLVPYLQPKHEYVLCICLTEFQKKLYTYYLKEFARAGQIGSDGKLEGGKKGGLFYDVQNLSRVWNHPFILQLSQERKNAKMLDDDDENDEEGSLKDFIDDEDESEGATSDSGAESRDSDVLLEEELPKGGGGRKSTRSNKAADTQLVKGLDEAKSEAMANEKCWWDQFLGESDDLGNLELGSKMLLLIEILKETELLGDKVLVFSQSLLSLDLIEEFLRRIDVATEKAKEGASADDNVVQSYLGNWKHGQDYFRMDGSTPPDTRKKWCNFFNKKTNHRTRLFLISTKAGGLGINLVAANRVVIFDASWNPAHDVQSIFRVYRFGQEKPVYIYRFLAKGTMEEKIYDRQVSKQSLSARVVDEHQIERHFSMNELATLYEYNDEPKDQRPVPKVPKDLLLAELLKKHEDLIWKFHDHDSLLENQVDENLTESERKAAWEEFENEKKGLVNMASPFLQNTVISNINPQQIQEQYRLQYPQLTEDQVIQATRAYIMQLQSGIHRKPAYDKSHYQMEMAKARQQERMMYPSTYSRGGAAGSSGASLAAAYMQQQPVASGSGDESWRAQMYQRQQELLLQQRQQELLQQQQRETQARAVQQAYAAMMQGAAAGRAGGSTSSSRAAAVAGPSSSNNDDVSDEIVIEGAPQFQSPPKSTSRRGRPRLDPDSDDPLFISPRREAQMAQEQLLQQQQLLAAAAARQRQQQQK